MIGELLKFQITRSMTFKELDEYASPTQLPIRNGEEREHEERKF